MYSYVWKVKADADLAFDCRRQPLTRNLQTICQLITHIVATDAAFVTQVSATVATSTTAEAKTRLKPIAAVRVDGPLVRCRCHRLRFQQSAHAGNAKEQKFN